MISPIVVEFETDRQYPNYPMFLARIYISTVAIMPSNVSQIAHVFDLQFQCQTFGLEFCYFVLNPKIPKRFDVCSHKLCYVRLRVDMRTCVAKY